MLSFYLLPWEFGQGKVGLGSEWYYRKEVYTYRNKEVQRWKESGGTKDYLKIIFVLLKSGKRCGIIQSEIEYGFCSRVDSTKDWQKAANA